MCLEELGRALVATDLHDSKLVPLPNYPKLATAYSTLYPKYYELTIKVRRSHKRDMHTHVPMVRRAVQTQVDAEGNGRPCRVLCAAVETYLFSLLDPYRPSLRRMGVYLVRGLRFQFREYVLRLCLRSELHGEDN